MRTMLVALAGLLALACEISPIVSAPADTPGVRYSDCERAAEEYCEYSLKVSAGEMQACVAEYTLKCVSPGSTTSGS